MSSEFEWYLETPPETLLRHLPAAVQEPGVAAPPRDSGQAAAEATNDLERVTRSIAVLVRGDVRDAIIAANLREKCAADAASGGQPHPYQTQLYLRPSWQQGARFPDMVREWPVAKGLASSEGASTSTAPFSHFFLEIYAQEERHDVRKPFLKNSRAAAEAGCPSREAYHVFASHRNFPRPTALPPPTPKVASILACPRHPAYAATKAKREAYVQEFWETAGNLNWRTLPFTDREVHDPRPLRVGVVEIVGWLGNRWRVRNLGRFRAGPSAGGRDDIDGAAHLATQTVVPALQECVEQFLTGDPTLPLPCWRRDVGGSRWVFDSGTPVRMRELRDSQAKIPAEIASQLPQDPDCVTSNPRAKRSKFSSEAFVSRKKVDGILGAPPRPEAQRAESSCRAATLMDHAAEHLLDGLPAEWLPPELDHASPIAETPVADEAVLPDSDGDHAAAIAQLRRLSENSPTKVHFGNIIRVELRVAGGPDAPPIPPVLTPRALEEFASASGSSEDKDEILRDKDLVTLSEAHSVIDVPTGPPTETERPSAKAKAAEAASEAELEELEPPAKQQKELTFGADSEAAASYIAELRAVAEKQKSEEHKARQRAQAKERNELAKAGIDRRSGSSKNPAGNKRNRKKKVKASKYVSAAARATVLCAMQPVLLQISKASQKYTRVFLVCARDAARARRHVLLSGSCMRSSMRMMTQPPKQ